MSGVAPVLSRFSLPIASTTSLGLPDPPRAIPIVYGRKWISGIKTALPQYWILAAHHIKGIVQISGRDKDGNKLGAAKLLNGVDPAGNHISMAELSRSPDGEVYFEIDGKDEGSGVISRAREIINDLVVNVAHEYAGKYQIFGDANPELAGTVEDLSRGVKSIIDEIAANAGLRVALSRSGYAPIRVAGTTPRHYTIKNLFNPKAVCRSQGALVNRVVARYNSRPDPNSPAAIRAAYFGKASSTPTSGGIAAFDTFGNSVPNGTPPQALSGRVIGAVFSSIQTYGLVEQSIDLNWVNDRANAVAAIKAALTASARPQWNLQAETDFDLVVFPGDHVTISHPHVPNVGAWLVVDSAPDEANHRTALSLVAWSGPTPSISIGAEEVIGTNPTALPGFGSIDRDPDDIDSQVDEDETADDPEAPVDPVEGLLPFGAADDGTVFAWNAMEQKFRKTTLRVARANLGGTEVAGGILYGHGVRVVERTSTFPLDATAATSGELSGCIIECRSDVPMNVIVRQDLLIIPGFICVIVQTGAGQVTVLSDYGVELVSPGDRFKTKEKWSAVTLYNRRVGAPVFHLAGDTAA